MGVFLSRATVLVVLVTLGASAVVGWLTDAWWPATLLAYVPRWPLLLPSLLLLPLVLATRRWVLAGALALTTVWVAVVYMGFNIPRAKLLGSARTRSPIRVTALNAGGDVAPARLRDLVDATRTDVAVVAECPREVEAGDGGFPGFDVRRSHGVCLFSRFTIQEFRVRDPHDVWELAGSGDISLARIEGPTGPFSVLMLHLETVREGLESLVRFRSPRDLRSVTNLRRHESKLARDFARNDAGPLLVIGDLNMPVDSRIYGEFWSEYQNAFSRCGWGYGRTKWTRWYGMRIDHILMDQNWECGSVAVGPSVGSDHRPLTAELSLRD